MVPQDLPLYTPAPSGVAKGSGVYPRIFPPEREMSSLELLLQGKLEPLEEQRNALRSGMVCPGCGHGTLDYNGLLVLECPKCGFASSEGGGCT